MADYTKKIKTILTANGCYFVRHGKGDHDVWYSPITNRNVIVDGSIIKRTSANCVLRDAGIKQKV